MDGLGLAREIRRRWPDLPILLATGYSREADAIGGEFPILPKPYHVSELSGALSATLNRWRLVH
jgi:DNA-binding response OmpR family regulator